MELSMISAKGRLDCERETIINLNTQENCPKFTASFVLPRACQPAGAAGFVRLRPASAYVRGRVNTVVYAPKTASLREFGRGSERHLLPFAALPGSVLPGFDNTAVTLPAFIGKRQFLN